jgi:hypothetical protein
MLTAGMSQASLDDQDPWRTFSWYLAPRYPVANAIEALPKRLFRTGQPYAEK